ncbi:MAG: membrane protein insertase YidC, partial [Rhodobacteraceae bacterium]|nr:membrane protein insertase YidC [Paracoccaceae bacterium]
MDDQNKNLILATVLSFIVLLGWFWLFPPPEPAPQAETPAAQSADAAQPAADSATNAGAAAVDTAAAALAAAPRIKIDTPRLTGTLSLLGGRIDDLSFKDYKVSLDPGAQDVRLLAPVGGTDLGADKPYYAVYGWSPSGGLSPDAVPGARTEWQLESGSTLAPGQPVTLVWDNGAGLVFRRTVAVDESYMFSVTDKVENTTGAAVRLAPYGIVARHGIPEGKRIYVLHEGVVRMADGELEEIKYAALPKLDTDTREGGPAELREVTENGWIGFTDKYWMTTLIPAPGQPFTSVAKYVPGADLYQAEARLPAIDVSPGATGEATTMLFAGAKEWETIAHYQNNPGWFDRLLGAKTDPARPVVDRFVDSIDWGWYFYLTKPMFRLLHWLHGAIGNMGLAIIALTVIIKALVFPLARHSYISMARMK